MTNQTARLLCGRVRIRGTTGRRRVAGAVALVLVCLVGLACDGAADGPPGGGATPVGTRLPGQEPAVGQPRPGPGGQLVRTDRIRIGGVEATAEIADTEDLRQRGLMYRDSLPPDHGMLFVYPDAAVRSFWMRNTRIPLDIAFIDAGGRIINIEQMEPQSDRNWYSQGPMMYALEMRQGWFEEHGVEPGGQLEF